MNAWLRTLFAPALLAAMSAALLAVPPSGPDGQDRPLKIIEKIRPEFPIRMLHNGILRGEAEIVFYVDATGRLMDLLVTAYSKEEFAQQGVQAIKAWKFQPGMVGGKPIGTIVHMTFVFETSGVVAIERKPGTPSETWSWAYPMRYEYKPSNLAQLDQPLQALSIIQPDYPKELRDKGVAGTVLVSFYVDESGKARLPMALQSPNDVLAGMAVAAVEQWSFKPPTSKGKPTVVCASQEFVFLAAK